MSQHINFNFAPWTSEEDAILKECWNNPELDFHAIAKKMPTLRTAETIQLRGYQLCLGEKARPKTKKRPSKKLTPWPADMPKFEDHPDARKSTSRARAAMQGSRYKLTSHSMETSLTGSSLEGASPEGLPTED